MVADHHRRAEHLLQGHRAFFPAGGNHNHVDAVCLQKLLHHVRNRSRADQCDGLAVNAPPRQFMVEEFRAGQTARGTEISLQPENDLGDAEFRHGNRVGAPGTEHADSACKQRTGKVVRCARRIEHGLQRGHAVKKRIIKLHHSPGGEKHLDIGELSAFHILLSVNSGQEIGDRGDFPNLRGGVDIINLCGIRTENCTFAFFHFPFSRR